MVRRGAKRHLGNFATFGQDRQTVCSCRLLIVTLVTLSVAVTVAQAPIGTDTSIRVEVVDQQTGQPIRRARVRVAGVEQTNAFTNERGEAVISSPSAPGAVLLVSKGGYVATTSSSVSSSSDPLRVRLTRSGAINGLVVDRHGFQPPTSLSSLSSRLLLRMAFLRHGASSRRPTTLASIAWEVCHPGGSAFEPFTHAKVWASRSHHPTIYSFDRT